MEPVETNYLELHKSAEKFLEDTLSDPEIVIAITSYQMVEILDLLRKTGVNPDVRKEIFAGFKTDKFKIKVIGLYDIESCLFKSLVSNIHIYDYLVALPFKGVVERIYSADSHFQHQDFTEIAEVINPLSPWILTEGKKPINFR